MSGPQLDIEDLGNGSVKIAWGQFTPAAPASYNVYVNGVLSQNVTTRSAIITGLVCASYAPSAIAPTPANGPRPQSMPPVGVVTPASKYTVHVTAVVGGVETARSAAKEVTPGPTSVMLVTPMKRLYPFPLTGQTEGPW